MSANVFQQGRPGSPDRGGDSSEDSAQVSVTGKSVPAGAKAVHRQQPRATVLKGRAMGVDSRKFKYDVVRGKESKLQVVVTKDDRLSAEQAGDKLEELHIKMGLATADESVLDAFDRGLFLYHSVNGGSTLGPGRGTFEVPGYLPFSYAAIRDILGVDQRRFFRAFADEIAAVNKSVIAEYDPFDDVKREQWGWITQVADQRGLSRYPYLCHDSADACTMLSASERAAVSASKVLVISTTVNSADRLKANNRVMSADSFDSTTGDRL